MFRNADFCTKLVQFCGAQINRRLKITQAFRSAIGTSVERIPALHVPQVPCTKPLGVGKLSFQVQAQLLDDTGTPPLLGLPENKVATELPVE